MRALRAPSAGPAALVEHRCQRARAAVQRCRVGDDRLLFGVAPAIYASTPDLSSLKEARRDGRSAGGQAMFRRALVAGEWRLPWCCWLAPGLRFGASNGRIESIPGSIRPCPVARGVVAGGQVSGRGTSCARFYRDLRRRARGAAGSPRCRRGHASAALAQRPRRDVSIIGREAGEDQRMQLRPATPGYLEAMRIPLRRGRYFSSTDDGSGAHVAILAPKPRVASGRERIRSASAPHSREHRRPRARARDRRRCRRREDPLAGGRSRALSFTCRTRNMSPTR